MIVQICERHTSNDLHAALRLAMLQVCISAAEFRFFGRRTNSATMHMSCLAYHQWTSAQDVVTTGFRKVRDCGGGVSCKKAYA